MKKLFYSLFALAMTAMTFTACEDVPAPYDLPTENKGGEPGESVEPTGTGTEADPFNIAAINSYTKNLASGEKSTENLYFKGKVVSIKENFDYVNDKGQKFGNATFYISDDGTAKDQFYCYRVKYLGNKTYTSGTLLNVGDEVIICGIVTNYNSTLETDANNAYVYSLNGETGGGGDEPATTYGSADNPITVAKALEYINALADNGQSQEYAYVKGKIVKIETTDENIAKYKNIDYIISDDGTDKNTVKVFRGKNLNNTDFTKAGEINVGDEVVVYGQFLKYVNNGTTTPELAQGNYLISVKAGGGGGGGQTGTMGTKDNPITVAKALEYINALADNGKTDEYAYVKGKIAKIQTTDENIAKYKNIDYLISDDGTENNTVKVFRGKNLNNTDFTKAGEINVGDEVVVYGQLLKYVSNGVTTPEINQGNYLVSLNGGGSGGGGGSETETGDNGDFEKWADGAPTNWKTASSAGNATLEQSTVAHGGSYSVKVGGTSSSNKRLGYKEMKLKAGEYTLKFYAKAADTEAAVCPGYVPVTDGSVGSYVYQKGSDGKSLYTNVSNNGWTEVTFTFTLTDDGTYCIVIMNSKSPGKDVLIDDVTLTTGSTKVIK